MSSPKFVKFADGKIHEEECEKPDSFRAGLYLYARRHELDAVSFIKWDSPTRFPVVVFALGKGPLPDLPGKPARGSHSHKENRA